MTSEDHASLTEILSVTGKKEAIVEDCVLLIDEEVASKRGMSAMAVKAGYKLVKGIKPGFVEMATDRLLPGFAEALEPIWRRGRAAGDPAAHLRDNGDEAAEALLGVTDARIELASKPVRSAYGRLRGSAKHHVEAAIPRLALLLERHAG